MRRFLAGILLLACCFLAAAAGCREVSKAAARVNGEVITARELDRFAALMRLCYPTLQEVWADPARRDGLRRELLGMLIESRLIAQEVARLGLEPALPEKHRESEAWLEETIAGAYGGSRDRFEESRRRLEVPAEDLALLPLLRLRMQALYKYTAAAVAEEELMQYIEENPEILEQPSALLVHRLHFVDEAAAESCLERLQRGERYATVEQELLLSGAAVEIRPAAWLAPDDPFLHPQARELLVSLFPGRGGGIVPTPGGAEVYWVVDTRAASRLGFNAVRTEAAVQVGHLRYLDYYGNLWAGASISVGE